MMQKASKTDARSATCLPNTPRVRTHQGQLEVRAQTSLLSRGLAPGEVGELGVGGNADNLGVDAGELLKGGVEREDLGGADDCVVEVNRGGMGRVMWWVWGGKYQGEKERSAKRSNVQGKEDVQVKSCQYATRPR